VTEKIPSSVDFIQSRHGSGLFILTERSSQDQNEGFSSNTVNTTARSYE
jgi:hypothetical protein